MSRHSLPAAAFIGGRPAPAHERERLMLVEGISWDSRIESVNYRADFQRKT
jgi:hypothetical protein